MTEILTRSIGLRGVAWVGASVCLLVLAVPSQPSAQPKDPSIHVIESVLVMLRMGDPAVPAMKVRVKLLSASDTDVRFLPADVYLRRSDGSRTTRWWFLSLFPDMQYRSGGKEETVNYIKTGASIDGQHQVLHHFEFQSAATARLEVQLKAGSAQEPVLLFPDVLPNAIHGLHVGSLGPVRIPK